MLKNMRILGIFVLMLIIVSQGVLGQVSVDKPADCEEGSQLCGTDAQGNAIIKECRDNEYITIEVCSSNERCSVRDIGGLYCEVVEKEVRYGEIEDNSFIGSLSTNHLLVGVIILLIILIVVVWRLKSKSD